jgi:N-acetylmuramoyl-L-alanine amidase
MDLSVKDARLLMPAANPGSILHSRMPTLLIGCLILIAWLSLATGYARAATIVLDPGHGGNDHGAGGDSRFSEKQFTLALAQKVSARLADRHQVELTRTADIGLTPEDRAALANHLQADLLISLHAAVSPYCGSRTAAIYFHSDARLVFAPDTSMQGTLDELDADRRLWERLQNRHQQKSQQVATALKRAFTANGAFDSATVSSVPLVALMGADLPAVLLEVGCIHQDVPLSAQQYEQQLNALAEPVAIAIQAAIDDLMQ